MPVTAPEPTPVHRSVARRLLRPAGLLVAAAGYAAFGLFLIAH